MLTLWHELRELGPRRAPRTGRQAESPLDRLTGVLADPSCHVVVARVDDAVVGMMVVASTWVNPLLDARAVQVSLLVVAASHRKHGIGRALLSEAVRYAEEIEAEEVVVSVLPTLREANRFYAQLGFSPQVVRRSAAVSGLRRRLKTGGERSRPVSDLALRRARLGPARVRTALRRAGS